VKVRTKHPQGKQNKSIDEKLYDLFARTIKAALRGEELTHTELLADVGRRVRGRFDGNVGWHVMTVKLDLEARRVIARARGKPQKYRLC
jgi:hypothetical protein